LLRSVGIRPLIGYPLGSPIQRLHISSEIAELREPRIRSLQDIALLSLKERTKILERRKARYVSPPAPPLLEDPDFGEKEVQQRPSGFVAALGTDPEVEDGGIEETKVEQYEADMEAEEKETAENLAAYTPESIFTDTLGTDFTLGGAGSVEFTSMRDSPAVRELTATPLPSTPDFSVGGFLGAQPYDEESIVTEELASPRPMDPPRMPVVVIDSLPGFGDAEVPVNVHQNILSPATPELSFTPILSPAVEESSPAPAAEPKTPARPTAARKPVKPAKPAKAAAAEEEGKEEGELPEEKEEEPEASEEEKRDEAALKGLLTKDSEKGSVKDKSAFLSKALPQVFIQTIVDANGALRVAVNALEEKDDKYRNIYDEVAQVIKAPESNSRALAVKQAIARYGSVWFRQSNFKNYTTNNGIPFDPNMFVAKYANIDIVDEDAWGHFLPYFQEAGKTFMRVNPQFFDDE
jgi:hypothetical protein